MSNGLTLPFSKSGDNNTPGGTNGTAFQIVLMSGEGNALWGAAYGTDQGGDAGTDVCGESSNFDGIKGVSNSPRHAGVSAPRRRQG